ncbi:hypothetical protein LB553_00840 [Mesorhizobium sp. CA8]|uniref:hypothetical protein n=1 Tax=Mesorhizobium sp. CA8 TaxID=2876637 RepID=UPI001CC9ED0D|nr:hypothetical protein [Mesorhizobium sp. CA8]MBZ9759433.1 hypothetical protein [Mesorhizobium sp. CA8]
MNSAVTEAQNRILEDLNKAPTVVDRLRLHVHDPKTFEFSYDDACELLEIVEAAASLSGDMVLVPKAALDWLNGEGPDDNGYWFGDNHEALNPKGRFWWREVFNRMRSLPTAPGGRP